MSEAYRRAYQAVSSEVHEVYRVLGRKHSEAAWGVARLCLLTIRRGCAAMYAYKIAAEDAGLSERSVRLYCRACLVFDEGTIEEFCTLGLGIMHFTACLSAPDPRGALDWVLQVADQQGGKIASVDQIYAKYGYPGDVPPIRDDAAPYPWYMSFVQ